MKRFLPKSVFGRNVLLLASGTTLAQAFPMLFSPLLTRIYTPEEFGIFALYLAISSVLSVVVTARYELAIMLPKDDGESANLLALSFFIAIIFSLLTFLILFALPFDNLVFFLLPLGTLFTGLFQALSYWNNRQQQFNHLSKAKIINSIIMISIQIALGLTFLKNEGLIIGYILGQLSGLAVLAWIQLPLLFKIKNSINLEKIKLVLYSHKDKPLLSTWGGLMDSIAFQAPTVVVTHIFGFSAAGFYNLASKSINLPLSLIGFSIGQVTFQHIANLSTSNPIAITFFIKKKLILMLSFSIPIFLILFFTIEDLFSFIFGKTWSEAGHYAALICIPATVKFAANPLSVIFLLKENTKAGVIWQILYLISITSGIIASWLLEVDLWHFACLMVTIDFILYTLYILLIFNTSKKYNQLNQLNQNI